MGFIQAFAGALRGTFADQWKDIVSVPFGLSDSAVLCGGRRLRTDATRTSNYRGAPSVISNGSLIVVPEGFALITLENGSITGYIDEPGGYTWQSSSEQSRSFFSDGASAKSFIKAAFERFKFGGEPGESQVALFVNLKEIPSFKFGTQSCIYWNDSYLQAQAGATTRGTCTLKIVNPILFLKEFVPVDYYSDSLAVFDLMDFDNKAAGQLFNELVASLAPAFSVYANQSGATARISDMQRDSHRFSASLREAVERNYHWKERRGIEIIEVALSAIDYDEKTRELLSKVQQADALMGARGNSNLQASFAAGLQSAGSHDAGSLGMAFLGMATQGVSHPYTCLQQPAPSPQPAQEDPYEKLTKLKGLLDANVITEQEFNTAKARLLNL